MNNELPEDIRVGRGFLEKSENAQDHIHRIRNFDDGIDFLNEYLIENPDSPHGKLIKNLKLAYTRSLLKRLPFLEIEDLITWFQYFISFHKAEEEVDAIIAEDPEFNQIYDDFVESWIDEAEVLVSGHR
jgi:hypothetical protein